MLEQTIGPSRRASGIRLRLIGMILVAVLPLTAAGAFWLFQQREESIAAAGERAQSMARRAANAYRELTSDVHALLQILANVPEVVDGSAETCAAFLKNAGKGRVWAKEFWVLGRDGRTICGPAPDRLGFDASGRAFFRDALKQRKFVVSDYEIGRDGQMPVAWALLPVVGGDGEVTRVLGVTLRMRWFNRFAGKVSNKTGATVWYIDADGTLLARNPPRADLVGKNYRHLQLVEDILSRPEGWVDVSDPEGPDGIYGYTLIPGGNGRLAVGLDRAAVVGSINAQIARGGLAVSFAMLIAFAIALAIARSIEKPLITLTAGAERARCSEDTKLPEVTGYAEVESLSRSLNDLLEELRKREQALTAARADAERATEEARATHARLCDALETVPAGMAFLDAEDRFILWNNRYNEIYPDADLVMRRGITFEERLRRGIALGVFPDAVGREEEWLAERLAAHRQDNSSHEQRLPNNRWVRIEERRTSDGGSIGVRLDITEAKRREQSFRLMFESNPLPMWVVDRETMALLAVNEAAVAHYGFSRREQLLSKSMLTLVDPEDHADVQQRASSETGAFGERIWRHRKADGTEIQVCIYSRAFTYEGRPGKLTVAIDVTEQRRYESRIRHLALHDGLTDLANRTLFRERLEQALAREQTRDEHVALLCIDLDRFKDINDTLGHPTGDQLLRLVAKRLQHSVREQDTVARVGGDEFAVVQDGVTGQQDAAALALRLLDTLSAPYDVDGHEVMVTPSVGIATSPGDGESVDELLNHADLALYRAKSQGRRSYCFFAPEMDTEIKTRRQLETDLRLAFINENFELKYQPVIDLATGEPSGFEALLRWHHPERGAVSPSEFIPMAEEIGLVVPLGEWVLRKGCAEAVKWPPHLTISINLSPLQFRSGDLTETVRSVLKETGLSPIRLELEITETVLLEDNDVNHAILHQLQNLGVRIAMDDFGTGYSSLSYLRRFPFNKIKIDSSFIRELPDSLDCMTITRGIVDLATGLGMTTTAEGVETPEQLYVLRTYGCTQGQGYLFSRPLPARDVPALLSAGTDIINSTAA